MNTETVSRVVGQREKVVLEDVYEEHVVVTLSLDEAVKLRQVLYVVSTGGTFSDADLEVNTAVELYVRVNETLGGLGL